MTAYAPAYVTAYEYPHMTGICDAYAAARAPDESRDRAHMRAAYASHMRIFHMRLHMRPIFRVHMRPYAAYAAHMRCVYAAKQGKIYASPECYQISAGTLSLTVWVLCESIN